MAKPKGAVAASMLNRATRSTAGLVATGQAATAPVSTTPASAAPTGVELKQRILPLDLITPNPDQPRRIVDGQGEIIDQRAMDELVRSIRDHGVLQPILVRPLPGDRFMIVGGERRWRAAQLAGKTHIPVAITDSDDPGLLSLLENIQREDLSVLELAAYLRRLKDERGISQDELAELLGKSKTYVSRTLGILDLPQAILEELPDHRERLSAKLLTEIVETKDEATRIALWEQAKQGASANVLRQMKALPDAILSELPTYQGRVSLAQVVEIVKADGEDHQLALWEAIKAGFPETDPARGEKRTRSNGARFVALLRRAAMTAEAFRRSETVLEDPEIEALEAAQALIDEAIREAKLRRRN